MKYSNTAITQLTRWYKQILIKCAIFNTAILLGGAVVAAPAMAGAPKTDEVAFRFGDVSISDQTTIDNTAFGGRRGEWTDNKYNNSFPKYQMEGRSFELTNSKAYVGPVTLALRELASEDHLIYNYQKDGNDVDLAKLAGVDFGSTQDEIIAGVARVIGASDAQYTAPGVIAFANRDNTKTAGSMNISGSNMTIDGATVNASEINVSNGSTLTFVKKDPTVLAEAQRWYTNASDIDSDGKSTLNADKITVDASRMVVNSGAELTLDNATIQNASTTESGGAIYNDGTLTVGGTFENNSATKEGGAIYNAGTLTVSDGTLFKSNSANMGAGISNHGSTAVLEIGDNVKFEDNFLTGGDKHGSVFYNKQGTVNIGDNFTMEKSSLGNIHDCGIYSNEGGDITIGDNFSVSNFHEAMVIAGNHTLDIGDNMKISNSGNGINLWGSGVVTAEIGKNATFENNTGRVFEILDYANTGSKITFDDNLVVRNNSNTSSADYYGNIYNSKNSEMVFDGKATFENNSTQFPGGNAGVFQNWNKLTFNGETEFSGNSANGVAGALRNRGAASNTEFNDTVSFTGNKALGDGGAIINEGAVTFDKAASFSGNIAGAGQDYVEDENGIYAEYDGETGDELGRYRLVLTDEAVNTASGGAIHNTNTLTFEDEASFANNTASANGGAIYNSGTINMNGGAEFTANTAAKGAAIYNVSGNITLGDDVTFTNNHASEHGNDIMSSGGNITIGDNLQVIHNDGLGDDCNIYAINSTNLTIGDNATFNGGSGDGIVVAKDSGATRSSFKLGDNASFSNFGDAAIIVHNGTDATIGKNATFDNTGLAIQNSRNSATTVGDGFVVKKAGNESWGAVLNRASDGGDGTTTLEFLGNAMFKDNTNVGLYNRLGAITTFDGETTFSGNTASGNGAAIRNVDGTSTYKSTITFNDEATFAGNASQGTGGAIYNEANSVVNFKHNAIFSDNTAGEAKNDIYNAGTINITSAAGQTIDFDMDGGIDGTGTVNINGAGYVDLTGDVKGQTINVASGELILSEGKDDGSNLTGSTVNVQSGAILNTIDEVANNYISSVILKNGSKVALDADLNVGGKYDQYKADDGASIKVTKLNLLNALSGTPEEKTLQVADKGTFDITDIKDSVKAYTSTANFVLAAGDDNSGQILFKNDGSANHGLDIAVDDTDANSRQEVLYKITEAEVFDDGDKTIKNADFVIEGENKTITAGTGVNSMIVTADSSLTMKNATMQEFEGPAIKNAGETYLEGVTLADTNALAIDNSGYMEVKDSTINAEVINKGRFISDPTTYTDTFTNAEGAFASFDADTFTGTATLANSGDVALKNSVTFQSGAKITGDGDIAMISGTTHFNDTVNSNNLTLASGANFDGTLVGGSLDTRNENIDTSLGGVNNVDLSIDAKLSSTGSADKFTSADGSTIKEINILGNNYGDAEKLTVAAGLTGATLDENLQINGANYYTDVSIDASGNIVFDDKLVNTSTIRGKLDSSDNPSGNVVIGDRAATTTLGTNNAKIALSDSDKTATVTAADGLIISDGASTPNTATLKATATGLNVSNGLTVGATSYGIDSTGKASVAGLSLAGSDVTASAAELNILDGATVVTSELNQLHESGVEKADLTKLHNVTASADDLNKLAGNAVTAADFTKLSQVTASAGEINVLHNSNVSNDDLQKLHSVTASAVDLNKLTGNAVTAADFTKLHGITADANELNVLDGITASTDELNYMDGVTSNVQTQLNAKVANEDNFTADTNSALIKDKTVVAAIQDVAGAVDTNTTNIGTLNTWKTNLATANGAANAVHASNIAQTADYRFVTDTQIGTWNAKQNALTAGNGIDATQFASGTIAAKAGDGTIVVDTAGIKVGTIQTANIANGAVNSGKLSAAVQNNLLDNATTSKGLTITDGDGSTAANIALKLASTGGLEEDATNGLQIKEGGVQLAMINDAAMTSAAVDAGSTGTKLVNETSLGATRGAIETKLNAGATGYDINAKTLKVAGNNVLSTADVAGTYTDTSARGTELDAKIKNYVDNNGDKFASVANTTNVITELFKDKALYIQETTGMDQAHSVAYNYNQSSQELLHGATSMLNADEILAGAIATKQAQLKNDADTPANIDATVLTSIRGVDTASDTSLVTEKAIATKLAEKQGTLTAGNGIDITSDTVSVVANTDGTIVVDTNGVKVGTINTANIAKNAVTTGKIADGAVNLDKLSTGVKNNMLMNATSSDGLTITGGNGSTKANISLKLASTGGLEEDATNGLQIKLAQNSADLNISGLSTTNGLAVVAGDNTIVVEQDGVKVGKITVANVADDAVTTSAEVAAILADPTTATDGQLITTKAVFDGINTVFNAKQGWINDEFGYNTATTDANTLLTAAGYADQNDDDNVGFYDALAQLNGADTLAGSVKNSIKTLAASADYSNTTSGLTATTIQGAIDEIDGNVDSVSTIVGPAQTTAATTGQFKDRKIGADINLVDAVDELGKNMVSLGADNVFTGVNTFKNDGGIALQDSAGGNSTRLKATADGLEVDRTIVAKNGVKMGDNTVTSIDTDGTTVTSAPSAANVMATSATVYHGAENGLYDGVKVKGDTTATHTIKTAIGATNNALNALTTTAGNEVDSAKVDVQWNSTDSTLATVLGNGDYSSNNYVTDGASVTTVVGALDTALKTTNDTIGARAIEAGTAGTLAGKTIGTAAGNISVVDALETLNATNVSQNGSMNTLAGLINGQGVDAATGALTGTGTTLSTGFTAKNLVAAANELLTDITVTTDGNYIKADKTAAENLGILDGQIKAYTDKVEVVGDPEAAKVADGGLLNNRAITGDASVDGHITLVQAVRDISATAAGKALNNTFTGNNEFQGTTTFTGATQFNNASNTFGATSGSQVVIDNGGNIKVDHNLTLGGANAISGSENTLDMGKNALTNVAGLTLVNGSADVALNADASGNLVVDNGVIANSFTVGTTGKGFDASGNASTGTLKIGDANAITGTSNALDMNGNDLTNVKDLSVTGKATVGTLEAGATTISATGATAGTPVSALSVTANNTGDGKSTSFNVTSDGVSVVGQTNLQNTKVQGDLVMSNGTTNVTIKTASVTGKLYGDATDTTKDMLTVNNDIFVDGMVSSTHGLGVFSDDGDGTYTQVFNVNDKGNIETMGTLSVADGNFTVSETGATSMKDKLTITSGGADITGTTTIKGGLNAGATGTEFQVGTTGNVYLGIDKFIARSDGSMTIASGDFNVATNGDTTIKGRLNAGENGTEFQVGSTGNVYVGVDKFTVNASDGSFNAAAGNFTVDGSGNTTTQGDLGVYGTSWLKNTHVDGDLAVTGDSTVGKNFAVAGTSYLHNTSVTGDMAVTGDSTVGQNFAVAGTSYLHNTFVTGDMAVSGTTKTTALTFDGDSYVAAMDQGAAAITNGVVDDQAKRTMATNATVAKTVGNLAALNGTHGVTSVADVASAIDSLATNVETATGGTFAADGKWTGTITTAKAVKYDAGVAYNNLVSAVDQVASNIGTAAAAAKGNITSTNTVNANLDQLDEAIGDRSAIGSKNADINTQAQTSVAAALRSVGDQMGDMNFGSAHYVAAGDDLSGAVRTLDSNLYRVEEDVRDLKRDFNRGMASMAAMSALVPNPRAAGNTSLSIGTGAYSGHTAMAIGGFHHINDNVMLNAGAAWGNSRDVAYRLGVTWSW